MAFRIRPFVYSELQEYARELHREISTIDYLVWGGFPKRVEFEQQETMVRYLENLNETIVINDLITRYKIRKKDLFRRLVTFILRSNSRIFSCKSITNYLTSNQSQCSFNTVVKYLGCLEEAYIINRLRQYSQKAKKELEFYVKLYNADVSLNSIKVQDKRYDLTHNLENIVYNELVYRGYELHVYVNGGKEIDFRASKNGKTYFCAGCI